MFKQDEMVQLDKGPARSVLALALAGKVGKVVADPPIVGNGKARVPLEGYTDVDFRDPDSKDDSPRVYRIERAWLSRVQ